VRRDVGVDRNVREGAPGERDLAAPSLNTAHSAAVLRERQEMTSWVAFTPAPSITTAG
jgi:hypothetical protein